MRFLALSLCLMTVFMFGMTNESFATEIRSQDGEKAVIEHGRHGGWGRRGGRHWRNGGGCYPYYYNG